MNRFLWWTFIIIVSWMVLESLYVIAHENVHGANCESYLGHPTYEMNYFWGSSSTICNDIFHLNESQIENLRILNMQTENVGYQLNVIMFTMLFLVYAYGSAKIFNIVD